jgi:hypothetical protein
MESVLPELFETPALRLLPRRIWDRIKIMNRIGMMGWGGDLSASSSLWLELMGFLSGLVLKRQILS